MFHIMYDGTMVDERSTCVLGGDAESITERLTSHFEEGLPLARAIGIAAAALGGPDRKIPATELEVAVLSRSNGRRAFQRVADAEVAAAL
jgi:proteasome alpha subunit